MIWKNTKITFLFYQPYECTAIEEYLEKMAEKGWLLVSITGIIFRFRRIKPKKIKYSVDIVDKISSFDPKDSDVSLEYREYCKAAGWNYVCEAGKLQVFYAEEGAEEVIPLHTDEKEKFNVIYKSGLYNVWMKIFQILLFVYLIRSQLTISADYTLTTNFSILMLVAMFFLLCLNTIEVMSFFIWGIRARNKLKENEFIPYNSYKQFRRKDVLIKAYELIIIFSLFAFSIFNTYGDNKFTILVVLMAFVPISISIGVRWVIDKNKSSRSTNLGISIVGNIIAIFLMLMVMGGIAVSNIGNENDSKVVDDKISLTLKDFGVEDDNDKNPYIKIDKSILAQRENYINSNGEKPLSYDIFESKYPFLVKFYEERLVDRYLKYSQKDKIEDIELTEIDTKYSNNIKVYRNNRKDFIIVSNNKLVRIGKKFTDMSEEKFLDIVYKKLFL